MSDEERTPAEKLLDHARGTLDRRRATMAALEERHARLRGAREGHGQAEPTTPASDVVRDLWRSRSAARRQAVVDRLDPPDDAA